MRPYTKENIISIYEQIKKLAKKSALKGKWLKSLKYIEALANWAYNFNWIYYDEELESLLKEISENTQSEIIINNPSSQKTVIIDSFCFDNRGLTQQYMRALMSNQMDILYICTANTIKERSDILRELRDYSKASILLFTDKRRNQIEKVSMIIDAISLFSPANIFLHLTPWDTSALMACHMIKGVTIFNINLTDHAFWMGASFIDYNIEFRPYGETISLEERGLSESQLLYLPYYPITPISEEFKGFPEIPRNAIIVFTGGALYKMLGGNNIFFRLMDIILDISPNVIILVAGFSADSRFDQGKSSMRNKDRVWEIGFRSDIDTVFEKIDIFLGTYPTSGALIAQYAAKHGKPILAFRKKGDEENKLEELVNHYQNSFHSFSDIDEFKKYASRLVNDKEFRKSEGLILKDGMITEDIFAKELMKLINNHNNTREMVYDKINYEAFFERYLDLENNNGFAATKKLVRIIKEDVLKIGGYRFRFSIVLFRLVISMTLFFIIRYLGVSKIFNKL